jgi:hypothetical protein
MVSRAGAFFLVSLSARRNSHRQHTESTSMLHFKLARILPKEYMARAVLGQLAHHGASVHRVGSSTAFELIIPIRAPAARRASLLKVLAREHPTEVFDLIDVTSFEGGLQYRRVSDAELDPVTREPRPTAADAFE